MISQTLRDAIHGHDHRVGVDYVILGKYGENSGGVALVIN